MTEARAEGDCTVEQPLPGHVGMVTTAMAMLRYSGRHAAIPALIIMAAVLGACASSPAQAGGATFVLVRHAEKVDDASKDPPLTATGEARARALATTLQDVPLRAVYATAYRRTQATAAPTAQVHSLPVTTYDAKIDAVDFATQLRRGHDDGTVLVVGHSNTVPAIAAALCECMVPPMADDEFDRRITVEFDAHAHAVLREDRY